MESKVIEVGDHDFEEKVIRSQLPVVVDFWAPWCGPCKAVGPLIEKIAEAHGGKARFAKVNIDDSMDVTRRFGIKSVPPSMFFSNGQMVDKLVGAVTKAKLEESLQNVLEGKAGGSPFVVQ